MNKPLIWRRWRRDQMSTAAIARLTKETEADVYRIISQGLDAIYESKPMPWFREAS